MILVRQPSERLDEEREAAGRAALQDRPEPTLKELQAAGCESLRAIAAGLDERGIPAARAGISFAFSACARASMRPSRRSFF